MTAAFAALLLVALAFVVESFVVVVPSIAAAISRQREQSKVLKNVVVMSSSSSSSSSSPLCDDVAHEARELKLFSNTPLIYSAPLSKLCQSHPVYLKLDCLQRSGSFKDRGMAHLCASVHKAHTTDTNTAAAANHNNNKNDASSSSSSTTRLKLISSSGGNAGLAITTVASLMSSKQYKNMDVSVIVPQTTKPVVITKLQSLGANVTIHGTNWNIADALARQLVNESSSANGGEAVYVSPYDNHLLWTGHSTVIDEIIHQLILEFDNSSSSTSSSPSSSSQHGKIGAILASVGGGGLLCGILEGIERNLNRDGSSSSVDDDDKSKNIIRGCKVVACETEGAASFAASFNASSSSSSTTTVTGGGGKKEVTMVRLNSITSIATSLGALEVTPEVIQRAHRYQERANDEGGSGEDVLSYVCTDSEAVDACIKFAADHRILVEPACGAALAPLYSERLRVKLLDELRHDTDSVIVVEVCGGSGVNLELLEGWKTQFLPSA